MEHFKDNSGCSGPKKSEIFWNNSRKVQYVFAGADPDRTQSKPRADPDRTQSEPRKRTPTAEANP